MKESAENFVNIMINILEKGIEHIPPYISNLLFRYSMMNLVYVIMGLWLFVLAGALWSNSKKIDANDDKIVPYAFWIILCIGLGIALVGHNLQDVFIPELWIISLLREGV